MRADWRRRDLMVGLGAVGLLGGLPSTVRAEDVEELPSLDELFFDEAEPPVELGRVRSFSAFRSWKDVSPRPRAIWAGDGVSVDTAHLEEDPSPGSFELTADVMKRALAATAIDPATLTGDRVLFGIRAAELLSAEPFVANAAFQPALTLREAVPTHMKPRCVLGVWDRATDTFWANPGSTVPNVMYMYAQGQALRKENVSNQLATGVYSYTVGTHRNRARSRQPAAFRLASSVSVLRIHAIEQGPAGQELGFTARGRWDFGGPSIADNIHADWTTNDERIYSSAGCQVLPGWLSNGTHKGQWRWFRIAAGLSPDPEVIQNDPEGNVFDVRTTEDGRTYSYVLLTSREVRLAAEARTVEKVRRGSSGERVGRLQRALGLNGTGQLDFETQRRIILRQLVWQGRADGVITRPRLEALGLPASVWG